MELLALMLQNSLAGKRSMMNPEVWKKMNTGHNHGQEGGSMIMDDSKEMESEQTVLNPLKRL